MTIPIPYGEETAHTYADDFVASCAAPVAIRRGVLLQGTCPRCHDAMEFPVVTEVFQLSRGAPAAADQRPLLCTCKADHPGRPPGDEGCGAYWNIVLTDPAS